jgi:hypothetical protein
MTRRRAPFWRSFTGYEWNANSLRPAPPPVLAFLYRISAEKERQFAAAGPAT